MIELAFGESPAGALKIAKSRKQGDIIPGATAVFGGTKEQQKEARKPHAWKGLTMEGSSKDVLALTLALDIGDISDMNKDITTRKLLLERLFGDYPGVVDSIWTANQHALNKLEEVKTTLEPIRMWVSAHDPEELCGMYYLCHLMRHTEVPLTVVAIPEQIEKNNTLVSYRSTREVDAEELGAFAQLQEPISKLKRMVYANQWCDLVQENAPLRAIVNGTVMGVPEYFYDFAIQDNISNQEEKIAHVIGRALKVPGVRDRWLFLRIQEMLRSGELILVSPSGDEHPYSGVIKKNK